jgi:zinc transport system ATP-binding protein
MPTFLPNICPTNGIKLRNSPKVLRVLDSGPAVELEGVTFSYVRGVPILRDVSLRIERGELLFVIGPNGGGKSTLLKVIVGSLKPEKGVVRLFGEDVRRFRDWWMVGYLPQQAATFFEKMALSVEELLSAARVKGRGMGLEDVVRLVGVDEPAELLPQRVVDLSGGLLQKVMLAMVLVNRPRLLLLDEPTVYMDQRGVGTFMQILGRVRDEWGVTTVIATHDVAAISTFATRVLCINREALYDGSIEELVMSEQLCNIYGFHVYTMKHGHVWSGK